MKTLKKKIEDFVIRSLSIFPRKQSGSGVEDWNEELRQPPSAFTHGLWSLIILMASSTSLFFTEWFSQIPLKHITKHVAFRAATSPRDTYMSIRNRLPSPIHFNSISQKIVIIH